MNKKVMKLALEALEEAWYHVGTFQPTEKAIDLYDAARTALREALAEQPAQQEPVAIYFMRDNHTFKKLSANVSNALVEIEQEFNDGWTCGMLCSKRKGFQSVHASGSAKRLEFFAECKATLEQWLPTSPPPQRKPLTDEEIYDMYNEPRSDAEMLEFARAIEAAHGIKGDA